MAAKLRRNSWIPGKERAEKWCRTLSRSMGGRNGFVNSLPNPTYGRGGAAGDVTATSRQGCGENTGRRFRRERASGPLVLCGGEDKKGKVIREVRVVLRKIGTWIVRRRSRTKKKLDEQRRRLQRQLRDLEKVTCLPQGHKSRLKETWQPELQDIEQKRNDLSPENQRMQKRSQKIQFRIRGAVEKETRRSQLSG